MNIKQLANAPPMQRYMELVRQGILTPNEVRKLQDYAPLADGDTLYIEAYCIQAANASVQS